MAVSFYIKTIFFLIEIKVDYLRKKNLKIKIFTVTFFAELSGNFKCSLKNNWNTHSNKCQVNVSNVDIVINYYFWLNLRVNVF